MVSGDYPNSTFYGAHANNYTPSNRPGSEPINKVVIHVTQGSFSSAINWFNNGGAYVSAHYTVRSSDGFIGQSVREKDIGWHAGNWEYNQTSVGIEHEGYVSDPSWFTDAMYRSSAKLTAYLCKKYKIPIDRTRIVGHNEVPYATHTDPGPHWDWSRYMGYVGSYASEASPSPAYSQVVDNATAGRFYASGNWKVSSWSAQRYGANYRYALPKPVSDAARFKLKIPKTADYDLYARWPANRGYNSSVPVGVRTTSGVRWVRVDQRENGGRWVRLGTFNLPARDAYTVFFSRWTKARGYIIADAVRVVAR
jgi:hypothetical protein